MHHTRRKSGHGSTNTSQTDVRKAVTVSDLSRPRRPQLARRQTPQNVQKLGKSPRVREKEWEEERWWDDDRESFPQFCMTCEKQFVPQDEKFLYCSEACRKHDQNASASTSLHFTSTTSHERMGSSLPFYSMGDPEPRDIVPRASPSRPNSNYWSPPTSPTSSHYTSAVSALKSLTVRPPSPPSPTSAYSSIFSMSRSGNPSPSDSYSRPSSIYSSTYEGGGYTTSAYDGIAGGLSLDRPLPSRRPGGIYSRPTSMDLVTPIVGR